MNDVVEIFTNIEVAERFINAYIEACKVTLEKDGETERIETLNDEHERIKTMFFALKMTKVMQLPQLWKGKYSGLEKLPKDKKFLLVANHRGIFDAVLLCHTFRKEKFVAVSKPENFTLPIAGPWIKGMGHLAIDRENNRNALKTIIKCIKYIEEDKFSIGICPEGTRNKKEGLLPFKSGCFKIASKAKCPLVICTITNADKVFKNFPFKKTTMEFHIVDVIEYEDLKDLSTHEIALLARRKMVENLNINESLEESKQMIE
jgi:1-acyl-sn-glycerol-3-phosphate acyltransferase